MPLPSLPTPPGGEIPPSGDGVPDFPGPTVFQIEITDLYGNVLTWTDELENERTQIDQYTELSVELGVSEERTATFTLSVYHPAVALLKLVTEAGKVVPALARMARIKYRGTTIFWGLITNPRYSTERANVVAGCQGPTFKLRHRQLNLGDDIVGPDEQHTVHNPSDHTTMKAIVEAAYDTPSQYSENIPDIGVLVENVSGVDAPEAFWADIQRGDKNWDKFVEISESAYGGEFDVVPYDPTDDELPFDTTLVEVDP